MTVTGRRPYSGQAFRFLTDEDHILRKGKGAAEQQDQGKKHGKALFHVGGLQSFFTVSTVKTQL